MQSTPPLCLHKLFFWTINLLPGSVSGRVWVPSGPRRRSDAVAGRLNFGRDLSRARTQLAHCPWPSRPFITV